MSNYTVRQLDGSGEILSEKDVEAGNTDEALRQLRDVPDVTHRIEVYDGNHERVRQIGADYWRQKWQRTRR